MRDNVISFRFSDAEVEALKAFQASEDKSPSQTAARLLRGLLTGTIEESTLSTPSTSVDIQELIKREVESAIANSERLQEMIAVNTAYLATGINEIKTEVDERLGKLKAR